MNWEDVKQHIHSTYSATDISPRAVEVIFRIDESRTHGVYISFADDFHDAQYAVIDTPVSLIGSVDMDAALKFAANPVIGGLCYLYFKGQDCISIRHSMRLEHLQPDEFDDALKMLAAAGDAFERELTGLDMF